MLSHLFQFLSLGVLAIASSQPKCKAYPGSDWPSDKDWAQFNSTLSGRLLKPSPPGAVCHPNQPTYNSAACPAVQAGWKTAIWHTNDPVSINENNWNNDTCLPDPAAKCSGEWYPIYVINATSVKDVKKGIDFARKNNVRLNVKGTGHDYLGRSTAPNSLSIWTHNMRGVKFHNGFKPQGCKFTIEGNAITAAAGTQMMEMNELAYARNLSFVSGGSGSVGVGGFFTGGGHSSFSPTYGLGADQVLEIEMVTPGGDILIVNECQNRDLFWAMRGGGGSTFGVLTSVTIQAYPSAPFHTVVTVLATPYGNENYWDALALFLSQHPILGDLGISSYASLAPQFFSPDLNMTVSGLQAIYMLHGVHPENTSEALTAVINKVYSDTIAPFPGQFLTNVLPVSYPTFWDWWKDENGPKDGGHDQIVGSRLMDAKALSNVTALREAYKESIAPGQLGTQHLVSGKGVHNAKPRGGSNSVNPSWRTAYMHNLISAVWSPFDEAEKARNQARLATQLTALRKLAPDTGAYVNEGYPYEPDWQHTFWGTNYERLLAIKKKVDPKDVFWCHPCVGNEGWEVVDDVLCKK